MIFMRWQRVCESKEKDVLLEENSKYWLNSQFLVGIGTNGISVRLFTSQRYLGISANSVPLREKLGIYLIVV